MKAGSALGRIPWNALITASAFALLLFAIAWVTRHRGPWYDEFYTQAVTLPTRSWSDALRTSWLHDNHPPFYYALMRASAWLGPVPRHRLVHLAILAAAGLAGWALVRRDPQLRASALAALLVLLGARATIHTASELRSYFLSLCLGAVLALSLLRSWTAPEGRERAALVSGFTATFLAFNTHIVTTLLCGALYVPFVGAALALRDGPRLRALLPAPLVAGAVFLGVTAIQARYWGANTAHFWIEGGLGPLLDTLRYALQRTLEANLLLLAAATGGGLLLGRETWRTRRLAPHAAGSLLLGGGLALGLLVLSALHLGLRPILIEKYLAPAVGVLAVLLGLCAARLVRALPAHLASLLFLAALVVGGLELRQNALWAAERETWYGTGRIIARVQAACPGTRVFIDPYWNADLIAMPPADNARVVPFAYREVARHLGFTLAPQGSRTLSRDCPNLFWAEHDPDSHFTAARIRAHLRGQGFALDTLTLTRVGYGWIASDRPLPRRTN
ncbi:MAG: hypothetical protein VYD90_05095 [Pseudomonadota bacterium]|nr:hypothetical protein [Pseudomonadota bacterium]